MIKKTLIAIIAIFTILLNITTADARALDYYSPANIYAFVEKNGYEFVELDFEDRHTFYEKDYKIDGKKIKATSLEGELRGLAHAYNNITKASASNDFKKAIKKDIYALEHMYNDFYDYTTNKEAFIESFVIYCFNEEALKKECPNLWKFLVVNVMAIFDDVTYDSWYWSYVNKAYELGLMTGATETLFKPNSKMNRAMVATVLHRMEGSVEMEYFPFFSDLKNNQYYTEAVIWCYSTGVVKGYNDHTFRPNRNITREEMVTMIYNFAKFKDLDVSKGKSIANFKDDNKVSDYAKKPMKWGYKNGIITGKDNGTRLDPKGTATRAECAKMLVQAYKLIY